MKNTKGARLVALFLSAVMLVLMFGCASSTETPESTATPDPAATEQTSVEPVISGANIEIATRLEGDSLEALRTVIAQFEEDMGVVVTLTEYASADYESAMKTRMASDEMPDVFETHGWSRLRYSEFLMPVNDESWYADEADLAKGILEGDGGVAYAQMLTSSVLGIFCNKTAAESVGVDVYAIETLDDFTEACQTIIDAGLVPLVNHNSGGDLTHVAGIFTTYSDALSSDAEAQLDGTWDWESFMPELEYFSNLLDMGAYWQDRATMTSTEDVERLASGESVFYFGNGYLTACADLNPDNEYVIIPLPAATEGGNRYIAGGEGFTCGIWKDTGEPEACRAWLDYLSVNGGLIAQYYGGIPVMPTITVEETDTIAAAAAIMEKYPNAIYVNMWDREYMPSGMWGVFGEAVGMLYADNSAENLVTIKDFLKQNYFEKYAAAQNG